MIRKQGGINNWLPHNLNDGTRTGQEVSQSQSCCLSTNNPGRRTKVDEPTCFCFPFFAPFLLSPPPNRRFAMASGRGNLCKTATKPPTLSPHGGGKGGRGGGKGKEKRVLKCLPKVPSRDSLIVLHPFLFSFPPPHLHTPPPC